MSTRHRIAKLVTLLTLILVITNGFTSAFGITISGTVTSVKDNSPLDSARIEIYCSDLILEDTTYSHLGNWEYSFTPSFVNENKITPQKLTLHQNFPNPFNPMTSISFSVNDPGHVEILVHNVLGEIVDSKRQYLPMGTYSIEWESRGAAGVYFYTIRSGRYSFTKKMIQLDGGNGRGLCEFKEHHYSSTHELSKKTDYPLTIIVSKLGFIPDTTYTTLFDGAHYGSVLDDVHSHATMIDLHNDILYQIGENDPTYHLADFHTYFHTDIPRLQSGGVDIQVFVVWISSSSYPNNSYQRALDYINIMDSEFALNTTTIQQARTVTEALAINSQKKIAGVMAVEGGHIIENSLEKLVSLYNEGMRYLTITWNNSTSWAVSAQDSRTKTVGLSAFGKKVIATMDSLGVIIDVSHTGIKTIKDLLTVTQNPIIASHSGVRALRDHYRNLYDDQIIAIANTGGVIGVVFYPSFIALNSNNVTIQTVISHIDYIVNLVGIDYVAIGSDFDGIETTPIGLEDVSKFPNLTLALLKHGYSIKDVEKILGGNFLRVFKQVCGS